MGKFHRDHDGALDDLDTPVRIDWPVTDGDPRRARTTEEGLWFAVLRLGLHDYVEAVGAREEVERWFSSDARDSLGAFASLCDLFAFDARAVRRKFEARRAEFLAHLPESLCAAR